MNYTVGLSEVSMKKLVTVLHLSGRAPSGGFHYPVAEALHEGCLGTAVDGCVYCCCRLGSSGHCSCTRTEGATTHSITNMCHTFICVNTSKPIAMCWDTKRASLGVRYVRTQQPQMLIGQQSGVMAGATPTTSYHPSGHRSCRNPLRGGRVAPVGSDTVVRQRPTRTLVRGKHWLSPNKD